ncbi:MAG: peptidase M28 [Acidobacteria bacterium]|nr:MAG: peptidase M28 [Acidobacteriota bacterium]
MGARLYCGNKKRGLGSGAGELHLKGIDRSLYTLYVKLLRLLAFPLFALALAAQMRSRIATGLETIKAGDLKADLTFLASDALEGRLSLDRGSEVAIQWIAAEFSKAGLKPLAGDSFLQPVPLVDYRTDRELTSLVLRRGGKEETFRAPEATGNFPNDGAVTGQVVFAGYGITAPELQYDDYAGIDVRGKIVLVFNHEPQEDDARSIFNGKGNTRYANARAKMMNAQRHGAVALLVGPDPNHPRGMVRGPLTQQPGQPPRPPRPTQAIADEASIPVFNVNAKIEEELLGVTGKKPADVQTSIDSTLKPASAALAGVDADLHIVNSLRKRATSYNVVGMVEGSDTRLAGETILFSGHYDHDGLAGQGGVYHGADDNGSGTVGVVELARAFAKNPVKPRRSLVFAVFAAEERGLLGSYYYVAHPLRPLATTRAVINFDMIGRNETPSTQTNGLIDISPDTSNEMNLIGTKYCPDYRKVVERANNMVELKLNYKWDDDTVLNVLFRSDQYPFLLHDIPAMWWFTGFHPDYHQTTDTADRINYTKMEKILKLAFIAGFDFAESDAPPRFVATGQPK